MTYHLWTQVNSQSNIQKIGQINAIKVRMVHHSFFKSYTRIENYETAVCQKKRKHSASL